MYKSRRIEWDEISGSRNTYNVLIALRKGKIPCSRPGHKCEDNVNNGLRYLFFCDVTLHLWVTGSHHFKPTTPSWNVGPNYPELQCHMPEEWRPQLHHCKSLKTCLKWVSFEDMAEIGQWQWLVSGWITFSWHLTLVMKLVSVFWNLNSLHP